MWTRSLSGFRPSILISALLAALVGFGGTIAVVLAAADAMGATQAQTASWLAGMGIGIALNATVLSWAYKIPITTAWSSPGASLIAGMAGLGIAMPEAVAAFIFCGFLLLLTAFIGRLRALVTAIPMPLANALLAGVLFSFVVQVFPAIAGNSSLTLPLIALFFVLRLISPIWATLIALATGVALSYILGQAAPVPAFAVSRLEFIAPAWNWQVMLSLGLPLYLVTMAGQNLPGLAVLRAAGYSPDTRPILGLTGLSSMFLALFGALTQNLAAITATLCTGEDAHPDKGKRWMTGPCLGVAYVLIALSCGWLVLLFDALPPALMLTIAAIGLSGPLTNALRQATQQPALLFPALMTFLVAQSDLEFFQLGGGFWGLLLGLTLWGLQVAKSRLA